MKIGNNIKAIREANKFSTQFMADELKVELQNYLDWENDEGDLTLNQLEEIANRLSCTVIDILQYNDATAGIRNYFNNNNGNLGTINNVQGINQEEIRKCYKELYAEELKRIPKLEKLLREKNIDFDF